ncbi:MAG: NAD-dependent epimerase/dehydratase family protein [Nitrospiraceae bacterium]|nr:NAD-dependent epimerase/dehydratase family protein [Nitrospiraceae bacterium]
MARFVVTGGGGFIGSNIVQTLCERGESARILDDFSTGNRANLTDVSDRVEVLEGSITDLDTCREAVQGANYVLHQAALPSVARSVEDPVATHAVNATGTLNMLVAARDAGVKRFVFASSSAAYGDLPALPKVEDMGANPLSPYAVQKLAGETYCRLFFTLYGLETVCLRYFNVFGPRQNPASQYVAVVPAFITMFLRGEAPVIDGDGEQSRDFTFVENVVHANLLACDAPRAAAGEVYNIACSERISVNELASLIQAAVGSEARATHGPARPGDVKHSWASIDKARRLLGFEPVVPFREGLERVIAWYSARG